MTGPGVTRHSYQGCHARDLHRRRDIIRFRMKRSSGRTHAALTALLEHTVLWSPLANTLRNPVHLDGSLAPPAAALV